MGESDASRRLARLLMQKRHRHPIRHDVEKRYSDIRAEAGLRAGDGGALAAIEVGLGEVEEQIDHAIAGGNLGDQRAGRRTDAFQRGERRKQWCEGIMFHGLTGGNRAAI